MKNKKNVALVESVGQKDIEVHFEREAPFKKAKAEDMVVYHIRPVAKPYSSLQFI